MRRQGEACEGELRGVWSRAGRTADVVVVDEESTFGKGEKSGFYLQGGGRETETLAG